MSPVQIAITLWSFRNELKVILFSFLVIILLPVIAVFILIYTGINVVSDALVGFDPVTKVIVIKDPSDGSVVDEIEATIVWPVNGYITLEFAQSSMYQVFHTGIDIANVIGTPISPFMDGTVTYEGESSIGCGKGVYIDHGNNISSRYCHLDRILVHKGQKVYINQAIGKVGSTGWSTGPHLHFEIRVYGIPVNPRTFLDTIE